MYHGHLVIVGSYTDFMECPCGDFERTTVEDAREDRIFCRCPIPCRNQMARFSDVAAMFGIPPLVTEDDGA